MAGSLRQVVLTPAAWPWWRAASIGEIGPGTLRFSLQCGYDPAVAGLELPDAVAAAVALAEADLLRAAQTVGFAHPVVRTAVYVGLGPLGRRDAHARAVRLLTRAGRPLERIAAYVLRCPPTGDPEAVAVLRSRCRPWSCATTSTRSSARSPSSSRRPAFPAWTFPVWRWSRSSEDTVTMTPGPQISMRSSKAAMAAWTKEVPTALGIPISSQLPLSL